MKNYLPTVSIITPNCYKLDEHRKLVFKRIISQSYKNYEFLIFNNGISQKEHKEIINYLDTHNKNTIKIKSFYSKNNIGIGKARRYLLRKIKSKYIIFIDSDDIADKILVAEKMKIINKFDGDIVVSNAYTFSSLRKLNSNKYKYRNYYLYNKLFNLRKFKFLASGINLIPNSGTLIERNFKTTDLLKNYPLDNHEDLILYRRLSERKVKILISNKYLIGYYINQKTKTGNKIKSRIWHIDVLVKHFKFNRFLALVMVLIGSFILLIIRKIENNIDLKFTNNNIIEIQ